MGIHANQVKWSLVDQVLVSGTNFLVNILLIRLLGLEQYGIFVLIWMAVQFFASLQNALIISPMLVIAPKYEEKDQKVYLSSNTSIQLLLIFILTLFVIIISFLPEKTKPDWLDHSLLIPFIASVIFFQSQDYLRRYLFVRQLPKKAFYMDIVAYGFQIPVILIILNLYPTFENALLVIASTMFLSTLIALKWMDVKLVRMEDIISTIKINWRSGKWLLGSVLTQWMAGNYVFILVGVILGPAGVGAMKAAQSLLGVIHILFKGLENSMPQILSRSLKDKGVKHFKKNVIIMFSIVLLAVSVTLFFIILLIDPFVRIVLDLHDSDIINIIYWFIPIYIVGALIFISSISLRVLEKTRAIFTSYLMASVFVFFAANALIKEYSLVGAMVSLLIVQLIIAIIHISSLIINIRRIT